MAFDTETGKEAGKKSKRGADSQLKELRQVYSEIIDNNKDNIQSWFDLVAKDDPAKALELMIKLSSYIIPKPKNIDVSSNDGNNFQPVMISLSGGINHELMEDITVSFTDPIDYTPEDLRTIKNINDKYKTNV